MRADQIPIASGDRAWSGPDTHQACARSFGTQGLDTHGQGLDTHADGPGSSPVGDGPGIMQAATRGGPDTHALPSTGRSQRGVTGAAGLFWDQIPTFKDQLPTRVVGKSVARGDQIPTALAAHAAACADQIPTLERGPDTHTWLLVSGTEGPDTHGALPRGLEGATNGQPQEGPDTHAGSLPRGGKFTVWVSGPQYPQERGARRRPSPAVLEAA